MVLASQFGSVIHPLTIMVALPLSAVGAVEALVAAKVELTVIAMIGMILLMGQVTKNSILRVTLYSVTEEKDKTGQKPYWLLGQCGSGPF